MPQSVPFEYSYDFTEKLEELRNRLGPSWRDYLNDVIQWNLTNTEDITDYLSTDTAAGSYSVIRSAVQSIATATPTLISFDTEEFNSGSDLTWVIGTPTRVTVVTAGVYDIKAQATFAANATGTRDIELLKGGGSTSPPSRNSGVATASLTTGCMVSRTMDLAVGDYIGAYAWQNSGGNLNVTGSIQMTYLGV